MLKIDIKNMQYPFLFQRLYIDILIPCPSPTVPEGSFLYPYFRLRKAKLRSPFLATLLITKGDRSTYPERVNERVNEGKITRTPFFTPFGGTGDRQRSTPEG